ncbi:MAG: aminotransferase class III-fold pyridoxal phosphate-dependent enzyme [Sedimentisphaerales bacterium]|nr:aminotransferase class III-fold pyridoxal phosphate-dependent enzyme [Sedimentisphaerales bacterium]
MSNVESVSRKQYQRSLAYLAYGSSTSSKAPIMEDSEPALIAKGKGCRVWDLDGNEYIDFRNGLGPVTLGYAVEEINQAISEQLKCGIVFGHPHPLEGEVAEGLVNAIPCAERVRFLKTGGEAVAACVKIARNATGRNKILNCGYNGWLNTLSLSANCPQGIALSQPSNGVPPEVSALHVSLPWGDIDPWKDYFEHNGKDVAAVVIASSYPDIELGKVFLPALRKLTQEYGVLMIMDEIVTGFRLAIGGAHEYFDFMPDMAVFSKGMANGMPISAYLGKGDLIDSAKSLGISSTFGGETLSLAAMKAVLQFYREKDVIKHLWDTGRSFMQRVNTLFEKYGMAASIEGFPVCPAFQFKDPAAVLPFYGACYRNGLSLYCVPYVNYSHKEADIAEAAERMERALKELTNGQ